MLTGSSAPPLEDYEAPEEEFSPASAPPMFSELSDQLAIANPHHQLAAQLHTMHPYQHCYQKILEEQQEDVRSNSVSEIEPQYSEEQTEVIIPFTDSQLHALYHNAELEKNVEFVDHWIDTQKNVERFQLDEMLLNYLRVRTMLCNSRRKYDGDRKKVHSLEKELWTMSIDSVEEEGECECGNNVTTSREVTVADFNADIADSLKARLKDCKESLSDEYSLHSFRAELLKIQIDDFLHSVISRHHGGVIDRPQVYSSVEEVRLSISVLFKFLRKDISDNVMVTDLRTWLDRMIALVLGEATLYDHLFIINHIMRCPAGVGKWAASYIQPPIPFTDLEETSFENPFLNQLITIMATILLPVKDRRIFVQEFRLRHKWEAGDLENLDNCATDKVWTVLDNEGSEDEDPEEAWASLRETDLVSLLVQIPVSDMFRYVLRVEQRDGRDVYDIRNSSQHSLLKLFAFSTQFVYLLREGLKTFNTPKYRQFAKRLGRLIRHTVHFVSDHWQNFKMRQSESHEDSSMMIRLQVEYDNFFLRAAKCIFSSQKLGTWQYLADIPFGTVSSNMLWRIFYVLHLDYREEHHSDFGENIKNWTEALSSPDLQLQFEEKCSEAGESEVYFLLSAFANMAIARDSEEKLFIERAVLDLFDVGFVCEATKNNCSKNCRDLLNSVCSRHPSVLTSILEVMSNRVQQIGNLCGYLVQDLPWEFWRPSLEELELVFSWLKMPVTSIENQLGRIVFGQMDWSHGVLAASLQTRTAIEVVVASLRHSGDPGGQGSRSLANMAMASFSAGPGGVFLAWAWVMVSRIHLHMMDRSREESMATLAGNQAIFSRLLDYDLNTDIEDVVSAAVSKNPLACYLCVSLTQVGHSLPELVERGFGLIKTILEDGRHLNVLELLHNVIPLLLCDESLVTSPLFVSIVSSLLEADQGYISMAKNFFEFPGPVTKDLGNMIENMIKGCDKYGLPSPRNIIRLWIKIITQVPDWTINSSALYLMDIICSHSFFDPVIHADTLLFTKKIHEKNINNESGTGFISWITGINYSGYKLVFPTSSPQFPYFAFFLLQAEDAHLRDSGLWTEIVSQLSDNKSVDESLAAAASKCQSSPPLSNQLPLYRWVQQAMDTPPSHPLQTIFWQRFFQCFLSRPIPHHEGEEPRGIGMKFFSGIVNSMYMKKIKKYIIGLQEYEEKYGRSNKKISENLCKMYRSFYIWLDESKILDSALYVPALSPVYSPDHLAQLLTGDGTLWLQLIDTEAVDLKHREAADTWDQAHYRKNISRAKKVPFIPDSDLTPAERIIKRLKSYESKVPPPVHKRETTPIPQVPMSTIVNEEALLHYLETPLETLNQMSAGFSTNVSAYGSLNCSFLELMPSLWNDEIVETLVKKMCPGTKRGKEKIECFGAAKILMNYSEAKKQDHISVKLESNRKEWEAVETRLLAPPSPNFVSAASALTSVCDKILRLYEKDLGRGLVSSSSPHYNLALATFYKVTSCISEDWLVCPSLRHFISDTLELLASVVISSNPGQALSLLDVLIQSPHLSPFLSAHFSPNITDSAEIIKIYQIVSNLLDVDGALPFVLLSKLDLKAWLLSSPCYEVRSQIINIIAGALARTGQEPDPSKEMLHGLQRKHLFQLFRVNNNQHYPEILKIMLALSERNQLDPNIWIDLLNTVTNSPGKFSIEYQNRDERLAAVMLFASLQPEVNLQETANIISDIQLHFHNERLHFGLYGLYPKYRPYVEALASYFSLLGLKIVLGQIKCDMGVLSAQHLDKVWATLEGFYGPWLFPLSSSERQSAATWIQQLTNESTLLPPWIPGDCGLATSMLQSFVTCVRGMLEHEAGDPGDSQVLSRLWAMYASHWAVAGVKDHVHGVIHPVLAALDWSRMVPTHNDLEFMVRVMGMFLPACHAFLGTFFVQINWKKIVDCSEDIPTNLYPSLLCLLVKLSGEPNVRQSGQILSILHEAESWDWSLVDSSKYEALAQWLVMSVDCRCVVKHQERSPLDEATLKLFKAAAEFDQNSQTENSVKKQKVWIKCCTRLLSSSSSKNKNFLSYNQPALHTAVRRVLEDITAISSTDPVTSPSVVKDFLSLLNSNNNSVLPGSALMVLQSWLSQQDHRASPVHSLLNQAVVCINDVKTATTVMEAVLETWFKETEDEGQPNWTDALAHISWTTGTRISQILEQSVQSGHILLLHAYLKYRRPQASSIKEEQMITSTVLDWLRNLSLETGQKMESKLPLLYRQVIVLLQRQNEFNPDQSCTVNMILQLCDILSAIADSSCGWGQNFLGAIGLGSSNTLTHKGRFLARSLLIYLRTLVNQNKTALLEKLLDEDSVSSRKTLLMSSEVKPHIEKMSTFKSNKAFSGIHDLIDWVLEQVKEESNTLADCHLFLDKIVIDKLYVDLFLL